jgi:hypothetical protein
MDYELILLQKTIARNKSDNDRAFKNAMVTMDGQGAIIHVHSDYFV